MKEIRYPIAGLLSLAIGVVIITSGLNVHSGEIFLWLAGIFGFLLLFPILLFAKSIQILIQLEKQNAEKRYLMIWAGLLGLSWMAIIVVGIWRS